MKEEQEVICFNYWKTTELIALTGKSTNRRILTKTVYIQTMIIQKLQETQNRHLAEWKKKHLPFDRYKTQKDIRRN